MSVDRWLPETEADIQRAIDDGLVTENHYFDAKREVEKTSGARKELARDLASFAIDGGSLLLGLDEDKPNRTWSLEPQPLDGLGERVETIARSLVDPPLFVTTRDIGSEGDDTKGYLRVDVPASARAPHMVDGVYYSRGDKTRTRMSDAEVIRFHAARLGQNDLADRLLDEEIARDPVADPKQGHLYVIAQPLTAGKHIAREFVRGSDSAQLHALVVMTYQDLSRAVQFPPTPEYAATSVSRSRGVARCSYSLRNGRRFSPEGNETEGNAIDIEFREDGGIRIFAGRMTEPYSANQFTEPIQIILDGLAVSYALYAVHLCAVVSTKVGYSGAWVLGLAANGLAGKQSGVHLRRFFHEDGPKYDEDLYREVTQATLVEIQERPLEVAERLVGALVRGLGTETAYGSELRYDGPTETA